MAVTVEMLKVLGAVLSKNLGYKVTVQFNPKSKPTATGKWNFGRGWDPKRLPK